MIHQYQLGGYNIVLDVCSGAVHAVDELAYDMIALYEQCPKEEVLQKITEKYGDQPDITAEDIAECYDDITALKEQGKLSWPEMLQIFNCGIGYVLVVPEERAEETVNRIQASSLKAWKIGNIALRGSEEREQIQIAFDS